MSAAQLNREKLILVLGLLGSAHDGEILSAARQAERLRAQAGLTWADILIPALPSPRRQPHGRTVADTIAFVLDNEEELTNWEAAFVRSIRRQRSPLSNKQIAILDQLVEKLRRAAARAA